MNGIFFIEAPFQLIGAIEAIRTYKLKKYIIYIRLSGNDKQLINLVQIFFPNDTNIRYFKLQNKQYSFYDCLIVIRTLLFILIYKYKFEYIFLGNFESKFLNLFTYILPRNKIVLLDDGIKTFSIQERFTDKHNYNMFTILYKMHPLSNQIIRYNKFEYLKSLYDVDNKTFSKVKKILFLGSKLSEIEIIEEKVYLEIIKAIIDKFPLYQIVYVPHREENIDKLNDLFLTHENLSLQIIDMPIEIYLLENRFSYYKILSFYSAALFSIKLLFQDIEVLSIPFDYSQSVYKDNINLVLKRLDEYEIKVLDDVRTV
ncbi:MAG: polysialyltransferase family glycosyltransferase [Arcobacteraceae bacterium]|nr:polysialyltransferase family glycosyltransferase [Arcobacteraceae bacterium]